MDCSAFRRHHVAFVDDTLPGDLLVAVVRHAAECPECAQHDTAVRRSLMLARNVCGGRDWLECSPDFGARLEARLRATPAEQVPLDDVAPRWWALARARPDYLTGRRARQGLAAAALLAAVSAGAALRGGEPAGQVQGLGGGLLATAPFGSPFAPVPANTLEDMVVDASAVATPLGAVPNADAAFGAEGAGPGGAGLDGVTLVGDDEVLDPAALVAPAAVGVPVWAAAVLAGEVPAVLWREAGVTSGMVRVGGR